MIAVVGFLTDDFVKRVFIRVVRRQADKQYFFRLKEKIECEWSEGNESNVYCSWMMNGMGKEREET